MATSPENVAPGRPPRSGVILMAIVLAGSTIEHGLHVGTAQHFPRDLNLAYRPLPVLYDQLGHGFWMPALHTLQQPGGWYNALLALWLHATGPSGIAFSAMGVPWFSLLLIGVARLAWQWRGATTAVAATALVAQLPVLILSSRLGWIHVPEATLVVLAAGVWASDPRLTRPANALWIGIAGALAITLRPSGVLWFLLLGASGGVAGWRAGGVRPRAIGMVLGSWVLAALVPAPIFANYVHGKLGVAERYAGVVPGLGAQLLDQLHVSGIVLVGLGIASLALHRRDSSGPRGGDPLHRLILAGWVLASLAMYAVVHCGLDNFPLFYVGLSMIAAAGLSRGRSGPWLTALVVLAWALGTAGRAYEELTVHPELPSTRVHALLDATCPHRDAKHRCIVVADGGLFVPHSEEPGGLELFLMQEPGVDLYSVGQRRAEGLRPDGLATWQCGAQPASPATDALVSRWGLSPSFEAPVEGCEFRWFTARPAP